MPKIKISSGFSGKIPTGSYQNSAPAFSAEVETEIDLKGDALRLEIDDIQKQLQKICYENFKIVADSAKIEKIKNDLKGFRFYKTEKGEYPSVTTVIDPEFKAWCSEDELAMSRAEGNINHARAYHFIKTGEWVDVKKLEGVAADLLMCKGRIVDGWDFPAFLKKYPMLGIKNGPSKPEAPIINHDARYAGKHDGECVYADVPTVFDFKRTPDRDKNFTQMAAYAKCLGMEHIKQMMIIPCNPDNAQGFSKPIVSDQIDKYFEVFMEKRKTFEEAYGV